MRVLKVSILALLVAFTGQLNAATVDGLNIHYTVEGEGPAIIFVHGWTCDISSWRDQVPAFKDEFQVISLDLPGHGQSGIPEINHFSMDLFAGAVEAVRAEVGAEQAVLVGHSMGVVVIKQYALNYPDRVTGLVAVDGPLDMRSFAPGGRQEPREMTMEVRETMIRGMFIEDTADDLQSHILDMMLGTSSVTANGSGIAMFDPAIRSSERVNAPTLAIVAGTGTLPDMATIGEIVPNLQSIKVAGTGHFLMMEKPDTFNSLLANFLAGIEE